jgi:hypothetical protein
MTASRCEQILAAFATAARSVTGMSARVYRDRAQALASAEMPSIAIDAAPEVDDTGPSVPVCLTISTLTVEATIYANVSPVTTATDAIRSELHQRLMTSTAINALVIDIVPLGREWIAEAQDFGAVRCRYAVSYQSSRNDLTIAQP